MWQVKMYGTVVKGFLRHYFFWDRDDPPFKAELTETESIHWLACDHSLVTLGFKPTSTCRDSALKHCATAKTKLGWVKSRLGSPQLPDIIQQPDIIQNTFIPGPGSLPDKRLRMYPDNFSFFRFYLFIHFGQGTQLVGSQFLNEELNPDPQQWKWAVLTTRPPGNSQQLFLMSGKWRSIIYPFLQPQAWF